MYMHLLKKQCTTADGVRRAVDCSAHRELNFVIEHVQKAVDIGFELISGQPPTQALVVKISSPQFAA